MWSGRSTAAAQTPDYFPEYKTRATCFNFVARSNIRAEPMQNNYQSSVCPHDCPSACALEIERLDEHTIGKVRGAKENSYTLGVICSKVSRYADRVHHPQRLTQPLKRTGPKGSGVFEPISWDQALDEVADKFLQIADEYGPESIWPYYYAGTMGQLQRDGINRLRHAMGYSRQKNTICTGLAYPGWMAGTGALWGTDPREIAESDLIVIWGCNAAATQINVMTHSAIARHQRNAKLVVIDPYRTQTAEKADIHLMPRPGTDGALACAVMHVLFHEKLADLAYLHKYTDEPTAFKEHLRDKSPEWAEAITGIDAAEIRAFATLYGQTKRSFIRLGLGFSRSRNGAHNVHAVSCLPAVTGAWQYRGGGALLSTSGSFHLNKNLIEGLDRLDANTRILDMSRIGPILCGDPKDIDGGIPVKGMLIQNTNPMVVAPDSSKVHQGMSREDLFVCVHEQFMTETAKMADIVLPATCFVEHNDIYQSYGQTHLQFGPKIIQPPGECHSNHQLINSLAKRLGAEHPGFDMTEEEIIDNSLKLSGYPPLTELRDARWLDCSLPFDKAHFIDGFAWPDKKFRFRPDWSALGLNGGVIPDFPDHWPVIDQSSDKTPFRLITPPARNFLNSSFTETPKSVERERQPRAKIHTDDARRIGLVQNEMIILGNKRGEIRIAAEIIPGIAQGTIVVEGIWPGSAFPEGKGINHLTSADTPAPSGGAVFHDTAVWVKVDGSAT
jgi:anaerobic selenocysteine-containing dehydrogenase